MRSERRFFLDTPRPLRLVGLVSAIVVTVFALNDIVSRRDVTATARFAVDPSMPDTSLTRGGKLFGGTELDPFKKQQLDLLKSDHLLNNAILSSELESLAMLRNVHDSVAWLRKHVQIVFSKDDFLAISLAGANRDKHDLTRIVNAIANAYDEELSGQREMSPLVTHDQLTRNLTYLKMEIKRKVDEYQDIAREISPQELEDYDPLRTLETNQIIAEINQLHRSLADVRAAKNNLSQQDRDESNARLKLYHDVFIGRLQGRWPMASRRIDIQQLQVIADDMENKLERYDQYLPFIFQIRQLQPAIISFDDSLSLQYATGSTPPLR